MLLQGFIVGFIIAAPVGPIGILCIRRSVSNGALSGFFTGLGAATADALYGAVAAFGITIISTFLLEQHAWIQAIGIAYLFSLGVMTFREEPATHTSHAHDSSFLSDYLSTFALTLTNPTTIASFAAVFTGIGIVSSNSVMGATMTVLGVFLGSATWWLFLSGTVSILRTAIHPKHLRFINKLSGVIIMGFAAFIAADLFLRP